MKARSQAYMPHVDGLRCLAVMSVLLFHFNVPGWGGGYVGVDVFFVISGYLITRIIADEAVNTGRFNFRNFYARRIRRILPVLIATQAVTTVLAIGSLTPADLVAYGKSLAASAFSLSNVLFWSESGYFDAASKTKPLLHTWSLSVEEQFYLFWPAFIYLSHRFFGRRGLVWSIIVAGVASFIANYLTVAAHGVDFKSDLFFLPQYRVFEFAIGGVGSLLMKKLPRSRGLHEAMMGLGLLLIASSIMWLREGMVFPYVKGIAPCLGTLLVIAGSEAKTIGTLFTNRPVVWIGTISYSLYLTHWPIVVFVEQYLPTTGWAVQFALMTVLSFATAVALHHLVETRFRYAGPATGHPKLVTRILATSVAMCLLGVVVLASNGMLWRYNYFTPGNLFGDKVALAKDHAEASRSDTASVTAPFHPLSAADIDAGKGRRFADLATACNIQVLSDPKRCFMDRPVQVLFFGNSHEPDAFNAFNHIYGKDSRVNLIIFGTVNDCDMALHGDTVSSPRHELGCTERFRTLNDKNFLKRITVVVYNTHQGFDFVAKDLWAVMGMMKRKNPSIQIIAIGSYMQTSVECSSLYNKYRTYDACKSSEFVKYFGPDERARSPIPQVKSLDYIYISKYELFCRNAVLSTCTVFANGEPAFYDQDHLSMGFARYMGDRIVETHKDDLVRAGFPDPSRRK
jgi:peptidoglycan/LPS O-acetylase OafA/YrhL